MCSEAKWLRQTGLVLLLPHGFDGAGPEHSTCHMERFLQNVNSQAYDSNHELVDLDGRSINFQVAQCTTPANYFHILRRQMLRNYRKPLVIAAPKVGLKHPRAYSNIDDFAEGNTFRPTLARDFGSDPTQVILCSGKVAFDIEAKLEANAPARPTRVVRVEELAPFPTAEVRAHLQSAESVTWVQEESLNQGAFQFAKLHVDRVMKEMGLGHLAYIGRQSVHSFCTGANSDHKEQSERLWKTFDSQVVQN